MDSNILKCKFCNFTTKKWYTKKGKRKSGQSLLLRHVQLHHKEEFEEIQRLLDSEYPETEGE